MTFERMSLANGVRILTAPMPNVQSTSCFLMFAAGSRYETKESNGIAHFAEHMFFKGTERRPSARDLSMEVDKIGGEFNAFTSKEYTGYYIRCAGEQRDTALDVLVDMLRNSRRERRSRCAAAARTSARRASSSSTRSGRPIGSSPRPRACSWATTTSGASPFPFPIT